jgi:hypothetical protein
MGTSLFSDRIIQLLAKTKNPPGRVCGAGFRGPQSGDPYFLDFFCFLAAGFWVDAGLLFGAGFLSGAIATSLNQDAASALAVKEA